MSHYKQFHYLPDGEITSVRVRPVDQAIIRGGGCFSYIFSIVFWEWLISGNDTPGDKIESNAVTDVGGKPPSNLHL